MDNVSVTIVSIVLLLSSIGLLFSHVHTWRAYQEHSHDEEDYDYRRRQYRRRMQTSAMLGVMAIAMPLGCFLTEWIRSGLFAALYWCGVMGIACWIGLLALVDIWATKHHFGRLRHGCIVAQAKLQHEIDRIKAEEEQKEKREHG